MVLVDLFVILVMAVPIVAIVLGVRYGIRWRGWWRAVALVPVVLLLTWLAAVLLSWPSDHTLWPFELLVYGPAALGYILIVRYRRLNLEKRQGP
jgi:hypothetical protein